MTCVPRWRKQRGGRTQICLLSPTPCSILASSHPMTDGSLAPARLLVFRVGSLACANVVDQMREILPRLTTTRIPGAPPVVAGHAAVHDARVSDKRGVRDLWASSPLSCAPSSPNY